MPSCRFRKLKFVRMDGAIRRGSMRNNAYEPLDWACAGIASERNVNSYFIVIGAVFHKNLPKVLFAEND